MWMIVKEVCIMTKNRIGPNLVGWFKKESGKIFMGRRE